MSGVSLLIYLAEERPVKQPETTLYPEQKESDIDEYSQISTQRKRKRPLALAILFFLVHNISGGISLGHNTGYKILGKLNLDSHRYWMTITLTK